jgi:RNA-directed DNA polymerase
MSKLNPYKLVRSKSVLQNAWRKVRENGLQSPSNDTREKIRCFDNEAFRKLRQMEDQLREKRFQFEPQIGVAKKRPGKKPRPLVVAEVKNRVVQRAILDVLQRERGIQEILATPTSYGGIKERGVELAVRAVCKAIDLGGRYFLRSDIEGFFTKVPRSLVLDEIARHIDDSDFLELLRRATDTELANLDRLGKDADLFPLDETGVAQGSPLSPLMGNIFLKDFDREMNGRGITCFRYIDDFILLGPTPSKVRKAFESAQRKLSAFGMRAYDPISERGKAEEGSVEDGFTFLGCQVNRGNLVQPSVEARKKLIQKVRDTLRDGRTGIRVAASGQSERLPRKRYAQALVDVDNIVRGWGHAFSFCTGRMVFRDLDRKIDEMISEFFGYAKNQSFGKGPEIRRRVLGIQLLADTPARTLPS